MALRRLSGGGAGRRRVLGSAVAVTHRGARQQTQDVLPGQQPVATDGRLEELEALPGTALVARGLEHDQPGGGLGNEKGGAGLVGHRDRVQEKVARTRQPALLHRQARGRHQAELSGDRRGVDDGPAVQRFGSGQIAAFGGDADARPEVVGPRVEGAAGPGHPPAGVELGSAKVVCHEATQRSDVSSAVLGATGHRQSLGVLQRTLGHTAMTQDGAGEPPGQQGLSMQGRLEGEREGFLVQPVHGPELPAGSAHGQGDQRAHGSSLVHITALVDGLEGSGELALHLGCGRSTGPELPDRVQRVGGQGGAVARDCLPGDGLGQRRLTRTQPVHHPFGGRHLTAGGDLAVQPTKRAGPQPGNQRVPQQRVAGGEPGAGGDQQTAVGQLVEGLVQPPAMIITGWAAG